MNRRTAADRANVRRYLDRARQSATRLTGEALSRYAMLRGLNEEELAVFLGCTLDGLHSLGLCTLPGIHEVGARAAQIASLAGVDPGLLAEIIVAYLDGNTVQQAAEPPAEYDANPSDG